MSKLDSRVGKLEARRPKTFEPMRSVILTATDPEPVAAPGERLLIVRLVAPQVGRVLPGSAGHDEG